MSELRDDIESGFDWIEKLIDLYKKYGFLTILKTLMMLFMVVMTLRVIYDPGYLFEKYTEYSKYRHKQELEDRSILDSKVKDVLPGYLYKYDCDRVWVIVYHNGTADWQYGTMKFEVCRDDIPSIKDNYGNFNLAWLDLPFYLKKNSLFIGDIDELMEVDKVLGAQLKRTGVTYLACTILTDDSNYPIGVLGASWTNSEINVEGFKNKMERYLLSDGVRIEQLIK